MGLNKRKHTTQEIQKLVNDMLAKKKTGVQSITIEAKLVTTIEIPATCDFEIDSEKKEVA